MYADKAFWLVNSAELADLIAPVVYRLMRFEISMSCSATGLGWDKKIRETEAELPFELEWMDKEVMSGMMRTVTEKEGENNWTTWGIWSIVWVRPTCVG